jgi:hypothetical protein
MTAGIGSMVILVARGQLHRPDSFVVVLLERQPVIAVIAAVTSTLWLSAVLPLGPTWSNFVKQVQLLQPAVADLKRRSLRCAQR